MYVAPAVHAKTTRPPKFPYNIFFLVYFPCAIRDFGKLKKEKHYLKLLNPVSIGAKGGENL